MWSAPLKTLLPAVFALVLTSLVLVTPGSTFWEVRPAHKEPGETGGAVLVVMDERPQMEAIAQFLKTKGGIESVIVDQTHLPQDWSGFRAVLGYIHGKLAEATEIKFIEYTKKGGRLVLLHHSISSGKARNRHFFDFLGIELTEPDKAREPSVSGGHYAWRDPIDQVIVNLHPAHYITSHEIQWPERERYLSSDLPSSERDWPALTLRNSEVYVNHKFTDGRAKTVLLGFKWTDDRNGQQYLQDRTGWYRRQDAGWVVYLQPGHSTEELRIPTVSQMILNAITWDGDVIIPRYWTGLKNLGSLYLPLADRWSAYDNSGPRPRLVAGRSESDVVVYDERVWNQILKAGR
jgi:hypothetical protein